MLMKLHEFTLRPVERDLQGLSSRRFDVGSWAISCHEGKESNLQLPFPQTTPVHWCFSHLAFASLREEAGATVVIRIVSA